MSEVYSYQQAKLKRRNDFIDKMRKIEEKKYDAENSIARNYNEYKMKHTERKAKNYNASEFKERRTTLMRGAIYK